MTVSYLDVDDEITDAVARLRTAEDRRFILVLPPGSRVATSRINFRLLAREGQERSVTVAVVSGDAGVRSLAISAGMPAYGSVQEAEASLPHQETVDPRQATAPTSGISSDTTATPTEPMAAQARRAATTPSSGQPAMPAPPPAPGQGTTGSGLRAGGPVRPGAGTSPDLEGTRLLPRSSASGLTPYAGTPVSTTTPTGWETEGWFDARAPATTRHRGRTRGRGLTGWLIRIAVLLVVLVGAAYVAYLTLPNVSITVLPRTETAGPLSVEIVADRSVAVTDPVAGVVPAEVVDIPLSATDDFDATGSRIEETRATGRVALLSENTVAVVVVVQGTHISTASGIEFETIEEATVPEADFDTQQPGRADVRIRAVRPGPSGNVPAGTITRLPAEYADQRVEASNPNATSGGSRQEVAVVTRADYDDALATLEERLDGQLEAALDDPATTPSGLVSYPETAVREAVAADPAAADVVDEPMEAFTLTAESVGTVLAVDETVVSQLAAERLAASVEGDVRLFPDSVRTDLGTAEVVDGRIAYTVIVTGEQYVPPDQAELVAAIRGRSVSEARVILQPYGTIQITPWPDFIGTVPDDPRRISVTVLEPQRSSP